MQRMPATASQVGQHIGEDDRCTLEAAVDAASLSLSEKGRTQPEASFLGRQVSSLRFTKNSGSSQYALVFRVRARAEEIHVVRADRCTGMALGTMVKAFISRIVLGLTAIRIEKLAISIDSTRRISTAAR